MTRQGNEPQIYDCEVDAPTTTPSRRLRKQDTEAKMLISAVQ